MGLQARRGADSTAVGRCTVTCGSPVTDSSRDFCNLQWSARPAWQEDRVAAASSQGPSATALEGSLGDLPPRSLQLFHPRQPRSVPTRARPQPHGQFVFPQDPPSSVAEPSLGRRHSWAPGLGVPAGLCFSHSSQFLPQPLKRKTSGLHCL